MKKRGDTRVNEPLLSMLPTWSTVRTYCLVVQTVGT